MPDPRIWRGSGRSSTTCRSCGISVAANSPARAWTRRRTTSTATPWTPAQTRQADEAEALGVRAGAHLGPLGLRGGLIQYLFELQDVVFREGLPAGVGVEVQDAPVRVADHYPADPTLPL